MNRFGFTVVIDEPRQGEQRQRWCHRAHDGDHVGARAVDDRQRRVAQRSAVVGARPRVDDAPGEQLVAGRGELVPQRSLERPVVEDRQNFHVATFALAV